MRGSGVLNTSLGGNAALTCQDVASKASMIRELLQSSGLHSQSSSRMARVFRALHVFSSKSSHGMEKDAGPAAERACDPML
eukprot:5892163-Amphidinium_carterae.1